MGLSAVTNLMDNLEEQKKNLKMTNLRVGTETVLETGADIALGALATVGATFAIGSSAPAVAVGAVAAGAVWAANETCEAITGLICGEENKKDLAELSTDFLIDGTALVGKTVGNIAKSVGNVVGDVAEDVGSLVGNTAKNLVSAAKSVVKAAKSITKWGAFLFGG